MSLRSSMGWMPEAPVRGARSSGRRWSSSVDPHPAPGWYLCVMEEDEAGVEMFYGK